MQPIAINGRFGERLKRFASIKVRSPQAERV